jgi:hypothetical protein
MSRTVNNKVTAKAISVPAGQRLEVKTQKRESEQSSKTWLQILTIALIVNFIVLMAIL